MASSDDESPPKLVSIFEMEAERMKEFREHVQARLQTKIREQQFKEHQLAVAAALIKKAKRQKRQSKQKMTTGEKTKDGTLKVNEISKPNVKVYKKLNIAARLNKVKRKRVP